jgi:hypothetical protein
MKRRVGGTRYVMKITVPRDGAQRNWRRARAYPASRPQKQGDAGRDGGDEARRVTAKQTAGRRARMSLARIAGRRWRGSEGYRPTPSKNRIRMRVSGAPRSQSRM